MGLLTGYDRVFGQKVVHDHGLIDHRRLTCIVALTGCELCIGHWGFYLLLLESI